MSKATRLIQLLHELRMHSPPVTAHTLAQAMTVSERTIYRDIDAPTMPGRLKSRLEHAVLYAKRFHDRPEIKIDPAEIRKAAWEEVALDISYVDQHDRATHRRVYPLSIIYFDQTLVLLAWCCLRQADRMFRLDRIEAAVATDESFRPKRVPLLRDAIARIKASYKS